MHHRGGSVNRQDLVHTWDRHVERFLEGGHPETEDADLSRWLSAYSGTGLGALQLDAMPEPFTGGLGVTSIEPTIVRLGLNPGGADMVMQGRNGVFAQEIRQLGSYSAWAATAPSLRSAWTDRHGRNRYLHATVTFAGRWHGHAPSADDVLIMELFPWHSPRLTGSLRPDPGLIREWVWEPLSVLATKVIFAFGKPWAQHAERLGLPVRRIEAPFRSPGRRLAVADLPSDQTLVVQWCPGQANPSAPHDVEVLRDALNELLGPEARIPARTV